MIRCTAFLTTWVSSTRAPASVACLDLLRRLATASFVF